MQVTRHSYSISSALEALSDPEKCPDLSLRPIAIHLILIAAEKTRQPREVARVTPLAESFPKSS